MQNAQSPWFFIDQGYCCHFSLPPAVNASADTIGMLATVMNGLAMRDALHRSHVNSRLMSAIPLNGVCDDYNWAEAIKYLKL